MNLEIIKNILMDKIKNNFFKLLEFLQNSFKNVEIIDDIVII